MSAQSSQLQIIISARDLASAQLREVGTAASGMGRSFGIAGQTAAGVFAGNLLTDAVRGVGGALGGAVTQAADFEHAMSAVAAVAGANSGQLTQLSQTALALGQDVTLAGVNATDAAAAMQELAAGGVSVTDIIGGAARGALLLASAGGLDFATAADIAANSMNAFRLSGQQVAHVADLFAAAANASSANVQDIGLSLNYVGPIAHSMGLSIEETTAALTELGSQGIRGEQAGTTLRAMFTALADPSKAAKKLMADLGLSFFDAQGHMLSLAGIAQELNTHLAGLTDQERAHALATIFSNAALTGATVITQGGAAAIDDYLKQINVAGSAAENGRIRNDNLAGSFEQLKSTVQTAAIAFGTGLIPALRGIVDTVTNVVNAAIPKIQAFGSVLGTILSAVGGPVLAIAAAVGAALAALVALGGVLTAGGIAAGFIATALSTVGGLLLPLAPIVLGIVAAVGALGVAWATNLGGIRTFAGELLNFAKDAGGIVRALITAFRTGDFNQAFGPIIEAVDRAFGSEAAGKVTLFVSNLLRFAQLGRDAVITFTQALRGDWFGGQTTSINGFVRTVGRITQLGRDAFITFKEALAGDWFGQNTAGINTFVRFVGILGQSLRFVLDALRPLPGLIADGFRLITGGQVAGGLAGFQARVSAFVGNILHILADLAGRLVAVFLEIGTHFVEWLTPIVPRLLTGIGQLFVRVVDFLTGTGSAEVGGAMAANMPNAFMGWVGPALGPFLAALGRFALTMLQFVRDTLPKVGAQLVAWGRAFGDWVTDVALPWLAPRLAALASALGDWITGTALPFVSDRLGELGRRFGDWVTGTAIPYLRAQLPAWLAALGGWVNGTALPFVAQALGQLGAAFGAWVTTTAVPAVRARLGDWLAALGAWIAGTALPWIGARLGEVGQRFGDWITSDAIPSLLAHLPEWLIAFVAWEYGTALPKILEFLGELALRFGTWVTDAAGNLAANLPGWIATLLTWEYTVALPAVLKAFGDLAAAAVEAFITYEPVLLAAQLAFAELLKTLWGNLGHDIGILLVRGIFDGLIALLGVIDRTIPPWMKALIPGYGAVDLGALRKTVDATFQPIALLTPQDTAQFKQQVADAIAQAQAAAPPPAPATQNFTFTVNGVGIGAQDAAQQMYAYLQPKLAAASGRSGLK